MVLRIKKGFKELIKEAEGKITTVTLEEARSALTNDEYAFIDLRDIRELQKFGKIPGAFSCPRGMLEFWIDPESPYHKEIFSQEKHFVFYCASAWRSALATKTALDMGLSPASHIKGGFSAWLENNYPVEEVSR